MRLKHKIWLTLGALLGLLLVAAKVLDYGEVEEHTLADLRTQALDLRALMMAMQQVYQREFIASGIPLNDQTLGLLPAHALPHIAAELGQWTQTGVRFNNVSDRPLNPANQADPQELAAMAWFRAHPQAHDHAEAIRDPDGTRYLHFTAPLWAETDCLKCHGEPQDAPAGMRERYDGAFGYQEGELRGLLSIRIPLEAVRGQAQARWFRELWEQVAVFAVLLVSLGWLLDRLVLRRLGQVQALAERLAGGDYQARLEPAGGDEFAGLARGLNAMADAVQRRDRDLQNNEARYRAAVETATDGVCVLGADGRLLEVNPAFCRQSGYPVAELVGMSFAQLAAAEPVERTRSRIARVLDIGYDRFEIQLRRRDGTLWPAEVTANVWPGEAARLFAFVRDLTEHHRSEELERFGAFQAGIAEMSTSVLHNIGNAITSISQDALDLGRASHDLERVAALLQTNAERTAATLPPGEATVAESALRHQVAVQREAAAVIGRLWRDDLQERAQRMAQGVSHIADIVRIQQSLVLRGGQATSFSLTQAVQAALAIQGDTFERHGIMVALTIPDDLDRVTLPHNRLIQALVNVLKNAYEAIGERARSEPVSGLIEVRCEPLGVDRLRLSISDNGCGLTPEARAGLFCFGHSTKERGTGFGLHATALFVQELGGEIALESPGANRGSRLIMDLPRTMGAGHRPAGTPVPKTHLTQAPASPGPTEIP